MLGVPIAFFAIVVTALLVYWPWPPKTLLTRDWKQVRLLDKVKVSHDTTRFRLSLGEKGNVLGCPAGKCIVISVPNPDACLSSGKWNGKPDADRGRKTVDRSYNPITGDETIGYFDIVVKAYKPGKVKMANAEEIEWTDGGKVSQYLHSKEPGEMIDINGPIGVTEYVGQGLFKLTGRTVTVKHVGMLAGGTGITPMLQILRSAIRDVKDFTRFTLIYANKTEDDILLRETLESLEEDSKGQFNIVYTLDFPPPKWKHEKGFVTTGMIRKHFPPPRTKGVEPLLLICGPPAFVSDACKKNLEAAGYPKTAMVTF